MCRTEGDGDTASRAAKGAKLPTATAGSGDTLPLAPEVVTTAGASRRAWWITGGGLSGCCARH